MTRGSKSEADTETDSETGTETETETVTEECSLGIFERSAVLGPLKAKPPPAAAVGFAEP